MPAARGVTIAAPAEKVTGSSLDLTAEVDLLVLEYLSHAGFEQATAALKVELRERREGKKPAWRPVGPQMQEKVKQRMLRALEAGERDEVMRLWDNFVPPLLRRSDKNAQKLEFYINIFFAIYPLHPDNKKPQPAGLAASMRTFKAYLETDGAPLAVTPEFLAYYAMPYVPEINRHPSFKELFTSEWAFALKSRLADFLQRTRELAAEPQLLDIVRAQRELGSGASHGNPNPIAESRKDMQALKQRLIDAELRAVEAKREASAEVAVREEREVAIRRGTEECADIAAEAIMQLGAQGGATALQSRLRSAEDRYALPAHTFDGRGPGGPSPPRPPPQQLSPPPASQQTPAPHDALNSTMSMLAALDFPAIKEAMIHGDEGVPALMQALRWRLTKPARRQRRTALVQYIQNDLLDAVVIEAVLGGRPDVNAQDRATLEQALRLINLFASEPAGRSYLISQPELIDRLCELLVSQPVDSIARQNCLGALQKLSLRRQPQNVMIDADVIAWIVQQLADIDSLSQYSVEYGTALLMNLALRSAGKEKCTDEGLDILNVLSQLMEHESEQVRTYVNGTLYSILVKPTLKSRAAEIGLPDSLHALIEHSDDTFASQINYILEQIEKEDVDEDDAQSDDEGGAEEEEEDPGDDAADADDEEVDIFPEAPVDAPDGDGEQLLCGRYMQKNVAEAQADAMQLEESMRIDDERRQAAAADAATRPQEMSARKRHHPDEPLQRPTTPRAADAPPPEKVDYGAVAMQTAGALPDEEGAVGPVEADATLQTSLGADAVAPPTMGGEENMPTAPDAFYPDPDAVDTTSPTIPMRNRLARTPKRGTRGDEPLPVAPAAGLTGLAPLEPTAPRARATVERVQRGSRHPTVSKPEPGSPNASKVKNKKGGPDGAE